MAAMTGALVTRRTMLLASAALAIRGGASAANDDPYKSGDDDVDAGLHETLEYFTNLFQLTGDWVPDFAFFDDGKQPNSFAEKPLIGADGSLLRRPRVRVGRTLVETILASQKAGPGAALSAVFGHEFAHVYQMRTGVADSLAAVDAEASNRLIESHADFLAGWSLPQAFWINDVNDIAVAASQFYALGDLEFEAVGHHGTPFQRQTIMASGFSWGLLTPAHVNVASARGTALLKDLFPAWFRDTP
jgi:hypothetical protein